MGIFHEINHPASLGYPLDLGNLQMSHGGTIREPCMSLDLDLNWHSKPWQIQAPWESKSGVTIWLFNIAMGNGPFIDSLPIKNGDFPWLC